MRPRSVTRMQRAFDVARAYCERPDRQLQDIDRANKWPKGTASHLLRYARELQLLVTRDKLPPLRAHDTGIGAMLGRIFEPTQVHVIEAPPSGPPGKRMAAVDRHEEDDLLHEALGSATAEYLSDTLRNDDILGVGAGRAVFHTARALATLPGRHRRTTGVNVIALHGRSTRRVWRETSHYAPQSIDSVRVTHEFASALPLSNAFPVHLPLVQKRPQDVGRALQQEASFLSRRSWARRPPSIAVIGLGIMGAPGAIGISAEEGKRMRAVSYRGAGPIASELRRLRSYCRQFADRHGYSPISDVCDRLIWVAEPDEAPRLMAKAEPDIRCVNSHLLTIEIGLESAPIRGESVDSVPGSLDQAQEVILAAGGRFKVRALYRILQHQRPKNRRFADTLFTDVATARALVALAENAGQVEIAVAQRPG